MGDPPEDEDFDPETEEPSRSRTGRFHVQHRGGARVEVGDPIRVGGSRPWMCAVKLVGHKRDDMPDGAEPTQTLLVRTGRGETPEEAQRDALANLSHVYGSPVGPPPVPRIEVKPSHPPPEPPRASQPPPSRPSLFEMLKGVFKK
jgi:hypothetical protein